MLVHIQGIQNLFHKNSNSYISTSQWTFQIFRQPFFKKKVKTFKVVSGVFFTITVGDG
jgi:hypothetical protein